MSSPESKQFTGPESFHNDTHKLERRLKLYRALVSATQVVKTLEQEIHSGTTEDFLVAPEGYKFNISGEGVIKLTTGIYSPENTWGRTGEMFGPTEELDKDQVFVAGKLEVTFNGILAISADGETCCKVPDEYTPSLHIKLVPEPHEAQSHSTSP